MAWLTVIGVAAAAGAVLYEVGSHMSVSLLYNHHNSLGQVWSEAKVMVCCKFGPQTTDTHISELYYI